jgi:hypothetical protein
LKLQGQPNFTKDAINRKHQLLFIIMDLNLRNLNGTQLNEDNCLKILFLLLNGLALTRQKYPSFRHNDIHANNVMLKNNSNPNLTLAVPGNSNQEFMITNLPYIPKIIDFGKTKFGNHTSIEQQIWTYDTKNDQGQLVPKCHDIFRLFVILKDQSFKIKQFMNTQEFSTLFSTYTKGDTSYLVNFLMKNPLFNGIRTIVNKANQQPQPRQQPRQFQQQQEQERMEMFKKEKQRKIDEIDKQAEKLRRDIENKKNNIQNLQNRPQGQQGRPIPQEQRIVDPYGDKPIVENNPERQKYLERERLARERHEQGLPRLQQKDDGAPPPAYSVVVDKDDTNRRFNLTPKQIAELDKKEQQRRRQKKGEKNSFYGDAPPAYSVVVAQDSPWRRYKDRHLKQNTPEQLAIWKKEDDQHRDQERREYEEQYRLYQQHQQGQQKDSFYGDAPPAYSAVVDKNSFWRRYNGRHLQQNTPEQQAAWRKDDEQYREQERQHNLQQYQLYEQYRQQQQGQQGQYPHQGYQQQQQQQQQYQQQLRQQGFPPPRPQQYAYGQDDDDDEEEISANINEMHIKSCLHCNNDDVKWTFDTNINYQFCSKSCAKVYDGLKEFIPNERIIKK